MLAVVLPRDEAAKKIELLFKAKIVDRSRKISSDAENVYVPVLSVPDGFKVTTRQMKFVERKSHESPLSRILKIMQQKNLDTTGVPEKWVRYGSSVIIRYTGIDVEAVGKAFSDVLNVSSVYLQSGRITGREREPALKLIHGPGGEVTHLENGIRYRFDPSKVMFSPGNVSIRTSMKDVKTSNKVVFDMFAGIGYFCLPIAKYGHPKMVYASDINLVASDYLRQNVVLNKLEQLFTIWNRDCREISLDEKADLIVMGNFESPDFLEHAVSNLNFPGEIIIHHLCPTHRLNEPERDILSAIRTSGLSANIKERTIVKSYSPHNWHIASTITVND